MTKEIPMTPEEIEIWDSIMDNQTIQDRNRACFEAWKAAGEFIAQKELGRISIREIFERGFMAGYLKRGELDGNPKG